jgi:predicted PurR-regulated permease PerM
MLKYFRSAIRHTSVKEPQSFGELGLQHIEALDTTNNLARPVVWPMLTIFMAAEGERFKELIDKWLRERGPLGLEVRDRLLETVRDAWYLRLERQGDAQQI